MSKYLYARRPPVPASITASWSKTIGRYSYIDHHGNVAIAAEWDAMTQVDWDSNFRMVVSAVRSRYQKITSRNPRVACAKLCASDQDWSFYESLIHGCCPFASIRRVAGNSAQVELFSRQSDFIGKIILIN